jgi:hypothetical protein
LRSKCSLPTHRSGVLHAAISPHAYLRSYMVGHRHISSNLLTTFLSLVPRSTFRELGCLDPATSGPCLVIFVFFRKANRRSMQLYTYIVSVHAKSYDSSCDMGYAVFTPSLPPARIAHVVSPGVPSVSKFARKALATSKEGVQVHCLGGRLCFGGGRLGRGVAGGANTTQ